MATNLLDLAKQALPPGFTDMTASLLGESSAATGGAIGSALPALIAGIAQKGATPGGAQAVMGMLDNPAVDTSLLSNLGGMFSGANASASSLMASGASLVTSLFGDRAGALGSTLASMSGMHNPQSANNLVAMLAPIVLAVIKRFAGSNGIGAAGLSSLLSEQAPFLQNALDSRLTSALGFASPAAMLSSLGAKAGSAAQAGYAAASGTAARAGATAEAAGAQASSWIGRWWPWIVAAIIVLFLLSRCMNREAPTPPPPPAPPPAATAPPPAPAPTAAAPAMPTALPAKVYFDVGQTTLSDQGKATVAAIADLVKKDGGKVDVTGYADSTGDAAQNAEIAKNRAMAVRDALQAAGVDAAMINLAPPANFTGTGGDAEARRVEVSKAQ